MSQLTPTFNHIAARGACFLAAVALTASVAFIPVADADAARMANNKHPDLMKVTQER